MQIQKKGDLSHHTASASTDILPPRVESSLRAEIERAAQRTVTILRQQDRAVPPQGTQEETPSLLTSYIGTRGDITDVQSKVEFLAQGFTEVLRQYGETSERMQLPIQDDQEVDFGDVTEEEED